MTILNATILNATILNATILNPTMEASTTKTVPNLAVEPMTVAEPFAGRFVLLYRLGHGGMGEVYAAYDPELDRKVAVKVLRSSPGDSPGRADARREGRALARLNHPNVVKVYDVVGAGDQLAIAMELVDGRTLADWLAAGRRSWREILEVFLAAGRGLAAAHAAGVIHRDFKPGNVMLTAAGEVRVVDFGIARGDADESADGVEDGLGTPAYLAPERLGSGAVDARSDQFSFCVALYEAVCASHPFFDAADRTGSLERLRDGRFLDPRQTRALPGWLERVLLRGLRPAPEERFSSMEALLAVLERGLGRRRRTWMAVAAALLLAGGGLAGNLLAPTPGRQLCAGAERQLRGVWDAERRQQMRAAFAATGLALAADTWPRVEAALDRYTAEWLAMKRDACEATHRRGEQSEQVLDLRMLCLDARLAELQAITDQLAVADREQVTRAGEAVGLLSLLSECGSSAELTVLAPLPRNPEQRARIERLNAAVAAHDARYELGQTYDVEVVRGLVEQARDLGYAPLVSRALTLQAHAHRETGEVGEAVAMAEEALWAAIAGEDRVQQARLYGELVQLTGFSQADHEKARWWKRFVEVSITALGERHPDLELSLQGDLFRYAFHLGEREEVIARTRRALEIGERLWGVDDLRLATVHNNLGIVSEGLEQIRHLERSLAIRRKHLGAANPRLAPGMINLAATRAEAGHYEQALTLALRALRLHNGAYPDGGSEAAYPETVAAQILMVLDRPAEAEEHLHLALRSAAVHLGQDHPVVLVTQLTLARVLVLLDRLEEAGEALAKAEEISRAALPAAHDLGFELLEARGGWFLERGRPELARGTFERARVMGEALGLPAERQSAALGGLGEAELALGRRELARRHLEAALERAKPGVFPLQNARIRWALARALPSVERARARALAEQALAELPGTSPWSQRLRGEIEVWLAAGG